LVQRSRWSRFATWAAVALLFGCGGSKDYALNFTGLWSGSLTFSSGGTSTQRSARFSIARTRPNELLLEGVCFDGTGPTAAVTDAAHFTVASLGCPPVPVTGCAAVTLTITGGVGALAGDTLTLHLDATVVGCRQSFGATYAFSGKHVDPNTPTTPTAKLTVQPSGAIALHTTVTLDASGSSDPGGSPLSYQWQLRPPSGSTATLSNPTGVISSFTPDIAGRYQVTLVVSNGSASGTEHATVAAGVPGVLAVVPATLYGSRGEAIVLDASGSLDGQGRQLSFAWTLQSSPSGSAATIADASSAIAHLTPDVDGVYVAVVRVTAGTDSASATATVKVQPPINPVSFRPIDAKYSRALERLVAIAAGPDQVHIFDPAQQQDATVTLSLPARCLAVSSDGLYAVVGHDAWVSYVDLAGAKIISTWQVGANAGDIVLSDPITTGGHTTRFAYVFPSRDQWVTIHAVDLATGGETTYGQIYAGMRAALQPGAGHIFAVEVGLSPAQLYRFDIGANGTPSGSAGSPYWGGYPMGEHLWISGDGAQILTGAGTRFRTSDMTYAGVVSLGGPSASFVRLASADWSAAAGRWLVQPANPYNPTTTTPADTSFFTVDTQYLASPQETKFPPFTHGGNSYALHGRFAFFDSTGSRHVLVAEVDPSASLLQDYVVLVL
jgi:hypothetical protein